MAESGCVSAMRKWSGLTFLVLAVVSSATSFADFEHARPDFSSEAKRSGLDPAQQETLIRNLRGFGLSREALSSLIQSVRNEPAIDGQKFSALVDSVAEQNLLDPTQAGQLKQMFQQDLGPSPAPAEDFRNVAEQVLKSLPLNGQTGAGLQTAQNAAIPLPPVTPPKFDPGMLDSVGSKKSEEKDSEESDSLKALKTLAKLGLLNKEDKDSDKNDRPERGSDMLAANSLLGRMASQKPSRSDKEDEDRKSDKNAKRDPRDRQPMMPFIPQQGKEKKDSKSDGKDENKNGSSAKGSSSDEKDSALSKPSVEADTKSKKNAKNDKTPSGAGDLLAKANAMAAQADMAKKSPLPRIPPQMMGGAGGYQGYGMPPAGRPMGGGMGGPNILGGAGGGLGLGSAFAGDPFGGLGNNYGAFGDGPPPGPKTVSYGSGGSSAEEGDAAEGASPSWEAQIGRGLSGGEALNQPGANRSDELGNGSPIRQIGKYGRWARGKKLIL